MLRLTKPVYDHDMVEHEKVISNIVLNTYETSKGNDSVLLSLWRDD